MIGSHEVEIFGHIKSAPRVCLKCQKMIEEERPIYCEKRWLPCRWSNRKRDGHIYEFPEELADIYKKLKEEEGK